jgi:hypothetical protein
MKFTLPTIPIIPAIILSLFFPLVSWGQAFNQPTITLSNWGGFGTNYTLMGSPTTVGSNTIYTYYDTTGPQSPFGFGAQKSLAIAVRPDGSTRLHQLQDWLAPWIINARVTFNEDGTVFSKTGYATNIDSSNYSVSWEGGGFGPGFSLGGTPISGVTDLGKNLLFQNGEWLVIP